MPLPDERPRQSVANLIGRFEGQTKRQSISTGGSARSTSAASHTTGDSAKEEVKEKREWPPKATQSSERPPIIVPSSSWTRRNAEARSSSPPNPAPLATQAGPTEDPAITPRPSSTSSITENPEAPPIKKQTSINPLSTSTPNPAKIADIATSIPLVKAPTSRVPVPSAPKSPAKSPVKAPARPSLGPQPLKPQHTGASIGSSARKSITKTVPVTPARAKTPSRPSIGGSARPKTPSSTSRPKTPSGLFAPTAASLAKARNAQPVPPTPTKKPTLSSSSAERLSKPTAASLSRARTPTSVITSPLPRGNMTRGVPKTKAAVSSTRPNKGSNPPLPGLFASRSASVPSAATFIAAETSSEPEPSHDEGGHVHAELIPDSLGSMDSVGEDESPAGAERDIVAKSRAINSNVQLEEQKETNTDGLAEVQPAAFFTEDNTVADEQAEPIVEADVRLHDVDTDASESETVLVSEVGDESKHSVDDIEHMVTLLESVSVSKVRPLSIASIPDEVHEIPDEE